ncbi:unnamed protein product (mitochondrion) [Plasmodiophora brassicae]|uniref:Serine/threonine-protein phosphatase 2A 55 kDa regulatory subunit B n=1 Tax=Plasmodiophora brassicae TaxID=37360 RepID=A0A3P3YQ49_PLABS|nr:unnamed protein product [Plasmodiophora brassicae]
MPVKEGACLQADSHMAAPSPDHRPVWKHVQNVGDECADEDTIDADTITAVAFSPSGAYLAAGDKSGRVWIHAEKSSKEFDHVHQYEYYTHFQSHKHDIDYLKSQDIEEKINMIRWCPNTHGSQMLLTTNDKTIKLWKLYQHFVHSITNLNRDGRDGVLRIPVLSHVDTVPACTLKNAFTDAHAYHINSISLNSDHETFISSDDLRINMWHLSVPNVSFNIIDIKPENMEELTEVVTSAQFHPVSCNQLIFSSSRGVIRLMDMRCKALLTSPDVVFESEADLQDRSFFSEIVSSISDATFTRDGRFIVSRDYLTSKIWDVRVPVRPLHVVATHDYIKPRLSDVYENDCIFDKFEVAVAGNRFITGSYNSEAIIYDWDAHLTHRIRPPKPTRSRVHQFTTRGFHENAVRKRSAVPAVHPHEFDFQRKCLHVAWHPTDDVVAVACQNELAVHQLL